MSDIHALDPEIDLSDPRAVRRAIRAQAITGQTGGMAAGV